MHQEGIERNLRYVYPRHNAGIAVAETISTLTFFVGLHGLSSSSRADPLSARFMIFVRLQLKAFGGKVLPIIPTTFFQKWRSSRLLTDRHVDS